jgi:GT2 family glycosyltransferase
MNHYPKVSIHIVTWNSMRFIPDLLESIMGQTYRDFNVLVIDNGSTDGIEGFLREHYPDITFIRNARNLGFSPAHNQGIRYAIEHWPKEALQDRFVLFTNPDVILTPTFLAQIVRATHVHPKVASFGGKLLRAFGENVNDEVFKEVIKSDRIDSVGLNPHRNRTVTDRGAGELDEGQYQAQEEVFGISGALALMRASALQDVRYRDEFFDQDFFAYKEDVDLAWRLQRAGWDALYVPSAVAYHYRGMYGPETSRFWDRLKRRREKSSLRNLFSTRNHWLMLLKNLSVVNALLGAPWIFMHEFGRVFYTFVFEHSGRRALREFFMLIPMMLKKRQASMTTAKRSSKDIRRWFR